MDIILIIAGAILIMSLLGGAVALVISLVAAIPVWIYDSLKGKSENKKGDEIPQISNSLSSSCSRNKNETEEKGEPWISDITTWALRNNVEPLRSSPLSLSPDQWKNLKHLSLLGMAACSGDHKQIKELPDEICKLKKLQKLIVGGTDFDLHLCHLDKLPECIGELTSLECLHLQFNNLTKLPRSIGKLKSLKVLKLGGNKLRELPKEIGNLDQLQKLTFYGNNIKELPRDITKLRNLKKISFHGNPVEINNGLTIDQIHWLEELQKNGCEIENTDIDDLKDIHSKNSNILTVYYVEYIGSYSMGGYETIDDLESMVNTVVCLPDNFKRVNISDCDGNPVGSLSEHYTNVFNKAVKKAASEKPNKKLSQDAAKIMASASANGITDLYHYTDRSNLESIKKSGGLYSWDYCNKNGIHIKRPGGNDLSRCLDERAGLLDYVRLNFNTKNPMIFVAEQDGRMNDPVLLKISPEVLGWKGTLFSDENATHREANIEGGISGFSKIDFKYAKSGNWSDNMGKRYVQAEVLIKKHISIEYITVIN